MLRVPYFLYTITCGLSLLDDLSLAFFSNTETIDLGMKFLAST